MLLDPASESWRNFYTNWLGEGKGAGSLLREVRSAVRNGSRLSQATEYALPRRAKFCYSARLFFVAEG